TLRQWGEADLQEIGQGRPGEALRFLALHREGGFWLDPDVHLVAPLDPLLQYSAVFGFENHAFVQGAAFGAPAGHPLLMQLTESYEKIESTVYYPLSRRLTDRLLEKGLSQDGGFQVLGGRVAVFPVNVLTADAGDGACVAERPKGKAAALQDYFLYPPLRAYAQKQAKEKAPADADEGRNPYEVIDTDVQAYGIGLVARQLCKAVLKRLLPKRVYEGLERRWLLERE
ncbi:hypothetical protein LJC49_05925, partial [Ruminococcaceae bacterium OttesenSCG-928-I18]|nr:hypothetical protein [Ruminococcaceae bacterium OttesenSCG-928-I18]